MLHGSVHPSLPRFMSDSFLIPFPYAGTFGLYVLVSAFTNYNSLSLAANECISACSSFNMPLLIDITGNGGDAMMTRHPTRSWIVTQHVQEERRRMVEVMEIGRHGKYSVQPSHVYLSTHGRTVLRCLVSLVGFRVRASRRFRR
jgi:hypothetical protein